MSKTGQFFVAIIIAGLVYYLFIAAAAILAAVFILPLAFKVCRSVYFYVNPKAKARYSNAKQAEAAAMVAAKNKMEAESAAAKARKIAKSEAAKKKREAIRDADVQSEPYEYIIGRHGNETLAIRYGIANREKETVPYFYYAKGGVKTRNPDRDRVVWKDARSIRLQKTRKINDNHYEVLLSDFRNRKAVAIIEPGTEYVKTFYPKDTDWFSKYGGLEEVLKGNRSMSLKELAHFHVEKTVPSR